MVPHKYGAPHWPASRARTTRAARAWERSEDFGGQSLGQSWDIPNLFIIGSSTFPSMSGFQSDSHHPGSQLT